MQLFNSEGRFFYINKIKKMFKNITPALFLLIFTAFGVNSQITVTNTLTPAQLVQNILLGSGITASNIKYNGSLINAQSLQTNASYFNSSGTTFSIAEGVLLSTGAGTVAIGPNSSGTMSDPNGFLMPPIIDADMAALTSADLYNGVVLEFDFVATGDTVSFKYMFGSEEYPDDFGFTFFDVFGFFLSGPGFAGPYTGGGVNLATLPGTTTPISIYAINPTANVMYYVDNLGGLAYGNSIQYDGTTVELTANASLICGATYHIKLGIANGGDSSYDSGVFLSARSFSSNSIAIASQSSNPGTIADSVLAEGCTSREIKFVRPVSSIDTASIYHYTISGNTNGLDFTSPIPDSVIFNIGVDTVSLFINPIADGVTETMEWIQLNVINVTACGDTLYDSLRIQIVDHYDLTFDMSDTIITHCSNINPSILISNLQNSIGNYAYSWSNSSTVNPSTFINTGLNLDSTYYDVTVTDGCGFAFQDSVLIINDFQITALSVLPNDTIYNSCPSNVLVATLAVDSLASAPYSYLWSNGSSIVSSNLMNAGIDGSQILFQVTTTNACGMNSIDSVLVINDFNNPIPILIPNDTIYTDCILDSALAVVIGSSGTSPYTYLWNNLSTNDSTYIHDTIGINLGSVNYSVTITDACGNTGIADGVLIVNQTLSAALSQTAATCLPDGTASSVVSGDVGTNTFQWIGPGLITPDTLTTQNITNISAGWYYYTVSDDVCTFTDSIKVDMITGPIAAITANPMSTSTPATITFMNNSTDATSYAWDFGNGLNATSNDLSSQTSSYTASGLYTITLTAFNGACSNTASIIIELLDEPSIINVPNVFTPNGDPENGRFYIKTLNVTEMHLTIVDRWGAVVFDETNANPKWNGDDNLDGVYFFMYSATGVNGEILKGNGFLHLIR